MRANSVGEFFGTLQQSTVEIWREHLKTRSYAAHIALNEFYDEIVELVDKLVENYMGLHGVVEDYANVLTAEDPVSYLEELRVFVRDGAEDFCTESELKSDIDDILSLIDSTLYKLKNLTESKIMNLSDYLNESLNESHSVSFPDKREWLKALKEIDAEQTGIPIIGGTKFNPEWLKKATAKGWEYEGNNADLNIWNSILHDVNVKTIEDVLDWLESHWDRIQIDLADQGDTISNCIDIFPTFDK